jgi:ribosomal protection tetracycline resistance protein
MPILNIGFLAHVDAGKTSLTERILFETAVISSIGEVDTGTTQTDTLELERQRGITIQSAVVSFRLGELKVNLIDTPGHADFIAEVDRALSALDAVVILVSSVEGVQPQTRKLVRAVREMGLPMLIFCNKIDRVGARHESLLDEIERKLGVSLFAMNVPSGLGSLAASTCERNLRDPDVSEALIDRLSLGNDEFLRTWMRADGHPSQRAIRNAFRQEIRNGHVIPVYFGSAITGAGVRSLLGGIEHLLPRAPEADDAAPSGTVFKIQRSPTGEKLVYLRLRAGTIHNRQRVGNSTWEAKITGIEQFDRGSAHSVSCAGSGEIVRLHGLREARIGDAIGEAHESIERPFAPPALESVVRPVRPEQTVALYTALQHLAEQDPLIDVRRDDRHKEISVRLFGEVQKEVISSMLANDYHLDVEFEPSQVICIERPIAIGWAVEHMGGANPFIAAVGIRIEPGDAGSGIVFRRPSGALPLAFYVAIEETVNLTLQEGLRGWQVDDVLVTVTETAYSSVGTTASDFRRLTPLVLMEALRIAGTGVYEPILRFDLQLPVATLGQVLPVLVAHRAIPRQTQEESGECNVTGTIPAATVHQFEQRVPGLTGGDGIFSYEFEGYEAVTGPPPTRERTDFNPLNRKFYLAQISQL